MYISMSIESNSDFELCQIEMEHFSVLRRAISVCWIPFSHLHVYVLSNLMKSGFFELKSFNS